MHIDELRAPFALSRHQIHELVRRGVLDPPAGHGRWAAYGPKHLAALRAVEAITNNNAAWRDILALLREEGITIVEYVRRRESQIRAHGLGHG